MKIKSILFLVSTILFVVFLYHQQAGLNFLIYGILLTAMSFISQPKITRERVIIAVLLLISTGSVALYGPSFCVPLSILLFLLLGFYQLDPKGEILMAPIFIFVNYLIEFTQVHKPFEGFVKKDLTHKSLRMLTFVIIPFIVVMFFTLIYREVNLEFASILSQFEWPELDEELIIITLLALFFNLGFWYFKKWFKNPEIPLQITLNQEVKPNKESPIWLQSGILVFGLLNVLLLVLLYFDFKEVYCDWNTISRHDLSANVHLGVNAVIGSIVLGIGLIVAYLYGALNFLKNTSKLKLAMVIWVILNGFLLLSSALKNHMYISELGLTEKRLGVYAFLLLTAIGLVYTYYKIMYNKTVFFIAQKMAWTFLIFGTLIGPINWNKIITQHNIALGEKPNKAVDVAYLRSLRFNTIELYELYHTKPNFFRYAYPKPITKYSLYADIQREVAEYQALPFLSSTVYGEKLSRFYREHEAEFEKVLNE